MYGLMALAALIFKMLAVGCVLAWEAILLLARVLAVAIPQLVRMIGTAWNRLRYGPVR